MGVPPPFLTPFVSPLPTRISLWIIGGSMPCMKYLCVFIWNWSWKIFGRKLVYHLDPPPLNLFQSKNRGICEKKFWKKFTKNWVFYYVNNIISGGCILPLFKGLCIYFNYENFRGTETGVERSV